MAPVRSALLTLALPVLALAGCGDDRLGALDTDDDGAGEAVTAPPGNHLEPPPPPRAIIANLDLGIPSCDAPVASFEVIVRYADDGSLVPNPTCLVEFDDGAVFPRCAGEHTFAAPGLHGASATVVDPATEETVRISAERFIFPGLEVTLEATAPACGLELSYVGAVNATADVRVSVSPVAAVVGPYDATARTGTVAVAAPGVYTVTLSAEDERTPGPICQRTIARTVEVVACDDPHCPD